MRASEAPDGRAHRSFARRLTRLFGGILGGEPNYLSPTSRDELNSLVTRMSALNDEEVDVLAESWQAEDPEERRRAWTKVQAAIQESGSKAELDNVRASVGQWMLARSSDFQGVGGLLGRAGLSTGARQAAAPAIIDKAAAILGRDGLDETEYAVLSRPFDALPTRH